ncbi:restriction system protein [Haloarcula vallismortis]|uniref:Restriction system protein n=2 Tax=Haloarcula vallismortis TaxID=28442 RepID=A0A1H2SAR9_HALVA|nr:restriction endonuclease [Haloarcula vallismortis]SDW28637.1 restriction system protein [Haloarcula vallismortis]
MHAAAMQDHLRDRMYEVSPEQFEILCKMVLSRRLETESMQVTAFRQDDGIDVEGVIDEDVVRVLFGAQVKRYDEGNTVSSGHVQRFSGALTQGNYQTGTYLTSSSFTGPARRAAENLQIHLVDGAQLAATMVSNNIGVAEKVSGYELQPAFWDALTEPERIDTIPSNEVPLANSFESLREFLTAIDETDGTRAEINRAVPEFDSRHADLYGTAGWLLGFVHEDTPTEVDGREVRRWGLTKHGVEYLRLHESCDTDAARERLIAGLRQVEIVDRLATVIAERGSLSYDELKAVLAAETDLSDSSVARRASTLGQWLTVLPEIAERPEGRSKKFISV